MYPEEVWKFKVAEVRDIVGMSPDRTRINFVDVG
jgi:hypothetical protein